MRAKTLALDVIDLATVFDSSVIEKRLWGLRMRPGIPDVNADRAWSRLVAAIRRLRPAGVEVLSAIESDQEDHFWTSAIKVVDKRAALAWADRILALEPVAVTQTVRYVRRATGQPVSLRLTFYAPWRGYRPW